MSKADEYKKLDDYYGSTIDELGTHYHVGELNVGMDVRMTSDGKMIVSVHNKNTFMISNYLMDNDKKMEFYNWLKGWCE